MKQLIDDACCWMDSPRVQHKAPATDCEQHVTAWIRQHQTRFLGNCGSSSPAQDADCWCVGGPLHFHSSVRCLHFHGGKAAWNSGNQQPKYIPPRQPWRVQNRGGKTLYHSHWQMGTVVGDATVQFMWVSKYDRLLMLIQVKLSKIDLEGSCDGLTRQWVAGGSEKCV